jgi:translocation and assembly module TamB
VRRALAALGGAVLTILLVLITFTGWLTLTTSGARWAADWLRELEPRLSLTVEGGSLARGLQVSDLAFRDKTIAFAAPQAEVEWTPSCLLAGEVCLDRVSLSGLRLRVEPGQDDPEPAAAGAEQAGDISLPLPVRVQLLQVSDAEFVVPGSEIRIGTLQASGDFQDSTLALEWARIGQLAVVVEQAAEPAPAEAAPVAAEAQPIDLPTVDLPLDLVLQNLLLEGGDIQVGAERFFLDQLTLTASLRGSEFELEQLQLAAKSLQAEAAGSLLLDQDYPLSMRLTAQATLPELPAPVQVVALLDGSVEQLVLEADLESPVVLRAEGRLQPLAEGLPFDLAVRWKELALPLEGEPAVVLREGDLQAAGSLDGYKGSLQTAVDGEQVPEGRWNARFAGDLNELRIDRLNGQTLAGHIRGDGRLGWAEQLRWQAALDLNEIDPAVQWPEYPGRLSGRVEVEGQLTEQGLAATVSSPGIEGELRGYPLALSGAVRRGADEQLRFDRLRLRSGDNRVQVNGRLHQEWSLTGEFDLPTINALLPDAAGAATGSFSLRGPLTEPNITVDMQGRNLRYQDNTIGRLQLRGDIQQLAQRESSLRWNASGMQIGEQQIGQAAGEFTGDRASHSLEMHVDGGKYDGRVHLRGSLEEQLDWAGELAAATVALPPDQEWSVAEPVALRWDQQERRLRIEPHCWRQRAARLCLTEPAAVGERGAVQLALRGFRLEWLSPWLPEGIAWQAPLSGEMSARWQPDAPASVAAELTSDGGEVVLQREDDDPLELSYRRLSAQLSLERNALAVELALDSERLGSGRLVAQTRTEPAPRPLSGEVALSGLNVGLFRAFMPDVQTLEGAVSVRGRLDGTLQDPRFVGDVSLTDGALAASNLPMTLTDIDLRADVTGSQAKLAGNFQSGDGRGQLRGDADWGGESWSLNLGIDGERLRFVYPPVANLLVSPDLRVRVQPKRVMVQGKVVVPQGQITLKALPEGAVAVSEDVVVINREGDAPQRTEDEVVVPDPAPGWSVTADVELILGDEVAISGYGLDGRLAGNLRVRQKAGGVPEAVGELRIEEGEYKAYGQELEIRQGQLLFSGPVNEPSLNVEAVRRTPDVIAGLRIEGQPEAPEVTLFSEPSLPQEEILSYLIRGRPLGAGGGGQQQLLTQAALSLGVFGGKGLAGSLAEELGVRDFELGTTGEGEETQVELSGYLTPDLLVRYGIGVFEPVNTLTLRYQINENFFVEAVSGLESALDFFYEFEF